MVVSRSNTPTGFAVQQTKYFKTRGAAARLFMQRPLRSVGGWKGEGWNSSIGVLRMGIPLGTRPPPSDHIPVFSGDKSTSVSLPPPMQVPLMNTRGTLFFPVVASNHCLITSLSGRLLISSTEYLRE